MRLLCITLGIGVAIWMLPSPPLMALVGLLMTSAIVGARLGNRAKLPSAMGVIAAGLALAYSPIITPEDHGSLQSFADVALAWVGLSLGTSISRPLFANPRLLAGSLCLYLAPVLTAFLALVFFDVPSLYAAQLAVLSGISAPVFLERAEHTLRDTWPLSLLVATMGLFLYLLVALGDAIWGNRVSLASAADIALAVLIGLVGIELSHHWLRQIRTPTGQFTSWLALAFLVALASWHLGVQPLFLAWGAGLALSCRTKRGLRARARLPKAEAFIGFALAHYVSGFEWPIPSIPSHFFALIAAMVLGKIAGGMLSRRFAAQSVRAWLPLLPQGLLAIVCVESVAPTAVPLYFLGTGVGMSLAHLLADLVVQKIKNGRPRARMRRTQAV